MKNQYNVIKDLVDSGIWVQVKDLVSGEYALFTEEGSNTLWHSGWYKSIEKSKYTENIRTDFDTASCLNTLNLEIVEYFRPNDLFPSKPFTGGTKVEVSIDDYKGMEFEVLESEETSDMGLFYRLWLAKTQQSFIFSASYVYPRIEKQEQKKPEDIIGKASKKALEDAGYTITNQFKEEPKQECDHTIGFFVSSTGIQDDRLVDIEEIRISSKNHGCNIILDHCSKCGEKLNLK